MVAQMAEPALAERTTTMRFTLFLGLLALAGAAGAASPTPTADRAIYRAAGFTWSKGAWRSDCGDPGESSYQGGAIERLGDLNGDGLPDALVTEGGTYCYGNTGTAFWLLAGQPGGKWKLMLRSVGMAGVLKTRGVARWPDISIGGPGFCFPVMRWNGMAYRHHRFEYDGKRCRPRS
jgi:hypothetical protein